jgi:DNA-binding beta-propeller fold protein YncE
MRISDFSRCVLGFCAAVAMLAGCGGSQTQIGAPGTIPQSGPAARHPDRGPSWMAPDAKGKDLLYVSDQGTNDVYVYSYPKGKLTGTLTGFNVPDGECVDQTGDVFITNYSASNIVEYAHGGTSPIATLSDKGYHPSGCSVDPTTGNLAVTNFETTHSLRGDVAIYQGAKGSPKLHYTDPRIYSMYFCGYDNAGNLFVDGTTAGSAFAFAELPSGGRSFRNITLKQTISGGPGGVQWDGSHVAVLVQGTNVIYQFTINGKKGTEVGSTSLGGASYVIQFWKEGSDVIGPDFGNADVGIWKYPAGGAATKIITGLDQPEGATVSQAQ